MTLIVKQISKKYPGENLGAVNGASFSLRDGEILSIVGESGSGKTTLLRMLAGLMKPDSGELFLDDEAYLNPEDQLIAGQPSVKMVFQDYSLMPNMSVWENVGYKLLGMVTEEKEERIDELLKLCGLKDFKDRKPAQLSGGQQQRLALARALADEPKVLLMDEPFSNIDPINKQKLLLEIQRITKELAVSLVFVTHDTRDAMLISDRIGFIQNGQLVQIDSPEEVYNKPKTKGVARFMGLVNEFSGQELENLGFKMGTKKYDSILIRSEDLILEETGEMEVRVIGCRFIGDRYLVTTENSNNKELVHYSQREWKEGEQCAVSLKNAKMIYF